MTANPFTRIREARNLNRHDLALALGTDYQTLYGFERGYPVRVSTRFRARLRAIGEDPEAVARDYAAWREAEIKRFVSTAKGAV